MSPHLRFATAVYAELGRVARVTLTKDGAPDWDAIDAFIESRDLSTGERSLWNLAEESRRAERGICQTLGLVDQETRDGVLLAFYAAYPTKTADRLAWMAAAEDSIEGAPV